MKEFIFFARVCTWFIVASPRALTAQEVDTYPNYVVIGAFAHQHNAVNFTNDANRSNFPARFEMNVHRNLYYVYVLTTQDREFAIAEAARFRVDTKYFDTWVYSGLLGADAIATSGTGTSGDLDPLTGQTLKSVKAEQPGGEDPSLQEAVQRSAEDEVETSNVTTDTFGPPLRKTADREGATQKGSEQGTKEARRQRVSTTTTDRGERTEANQVVAENTITPQQLGDGDTEQTSARADSGLPADEIQSKGAGQNLATSAVEIPAPKRATTEPLEATDVEGKDFYFHLLRADNGKTIGGEVDAIDFERSRKMATYPANEAVTIRMPSTKSRHISFVCQVFGYRKQQKEFDPNTPSEDLYLDEQGNLVVPFELIRLQKGDIAIMYNVFFFKDAAVMRPESRYEVTNLLELLNENPSYNIVIHGHTNGNASGKIIRMDQPGNFYSLTGTKQGMGSAKKLSEERANVIKEFLVSSGIPENRMQVKAWGGKKPIHDKHSVRANENVRVEIEILSK
jgi:outer membrane protein OmpA-like peptidoglycan-associated protein